MTKRKAEDAEEEEEEELGSSVELDAHASEWLLQHNVFIVLGAMKCGTTALRFHLMETMKEDNTALPWQELHFFDEEAEHRLGPAHYASWFDWQSREPAPAAIGDVTPSYLYIPEAVHRIHAMLPHARLVVMLRNPIDRLLSHHNHDLDKGRKVGNILERMDREIETAAKPSRWDMFGRGLYVSQLENVLKVFPREQLLCVISERYRAHPLRELRRIRHFLGLPDRCASGADISDNLEEHHVREWYWEKISMEERARCRDLYADDVANLKVLLRDPIPEWKDFE